jgi:hypothetical protein
LVVDEGVIVPEGRSFSLVRSELEPYEWCVGTVGRGSAAMVRDGKWACEYSEDEIISMWKASRQCGKGITVSGVLAHQSMALRRW